MNHLSVYKKKYNLYQKILVIDSYLDIPTNSDAIFTLLGWFQAEKDELVRIELFHTITILLVNLLKS